MLSFTNLILGEFPVRYLASFYLFSVMDSFEWFWAGCCCKNILLMLEFLKVLFWVPHFSFYTLMNFQMMLSVKLLSVLTTKCLNAHLRTKWLCVQVQLQSLKIQILYLLQARSSLTFRQLWSVDSL